MESYKQEFIEFMVESDVLKFGEFTLKSGRKSPFFMNAGAYVTGSQLKKEQSKDQGQDQKDSKLSKFCPVGHTIHTANCLPKRRHAVNEWQ